MEAARVSPIAVANAPVSYGAFEVTVRGPLGRGMHRTVFVAEGLAVGFRPGVRTLSAEGLKPGTATLTAAVGATLTEPGN